jgi:hypothetical protein
MLRDRSYVCAGATEAPQRGRGEFRQDFNWAAGRSKLHPEPAAAAERDAGGRHAPYIWYGCQTYLPHNLCPVPDCLTILRADHARERDHRDRLPRPGHPEWTTHAAALEAEGNSLRENRRLSRPQFDGAGLRAWRMPSSSSSLINILAAFAGQGARSRNALLKSNRAGCRRKHHLAQRIALERTSGVLALSSFPPNGVNVFCLVAANSRC